jgi:hypothetical protein
MYSLDKWTINPANLEKYVYIITYFIFLTLPFNLISFQMQYVIASVLSLALILINRYIFKRQDIFLYGLLSLIFLAIIIQLTTETGIVVYSQIIFIFLAFLLLSTSKKLVINLNRDEAIFLLLIGILFFSFQFIFYDYFGSPVLAIGDPNFSAYYILLFFFLSQKIKTKIGIFFCILSAYFLLSRNLIFSMFFFYLTYYMRPHIWEFIRKFNVNFFYLTITSLVMALAIPFLFTFSNEPEGVRDVTRLFTVLDASNKDRFEINSLVIKAFIYDPYQFIFGFGANYPNFMIFNGKVVHNSFIEVLLTFGVFYSFIYFIILSELIKNIFTQDNVPYIISYIFFLSFLHGGFYSFGFLFFLITLKLNRI